MVWYVVGLKWYCDNCIENSKNNNYCNILGCWFDDKTMLEEAKHMWSEMSEDVQNDYGEDYFEYKVRTLPEYNSSNVRYNLFKPFTCDVFVPINFSLI